MHFLVRYALVALMGVQGFAFVASVARASEADDRAAVEAAAQAWAQAFNGRTIATLNEMVTEDIVLLDADLPPVSGRKAAQKALAEAVGAARTQVVSATKEIVVLGDVAWRIGALTHKAPGAVVVNNPSLEIWKRVGGRWKLHRQMSSGVLAQPRLAPRPLPPEPVLDRPVN